MLALVSEKHFGKVTLVTIEAFQGAWEGLGEASDLGIKRLVILGQNVRSLTKVVLRLW